MTLTVAPARPDAPDTSDYTIVHGAIRRAGHALTAAAADLTVGDQDRFDAFLRYWHGHTGEILSHHGIEDTIFFPALRERSPEAVAVLDQLDREHHELDRLMDDAELALGRVLAGADAAEAVAALHELAVVMDAHLDLEESDLIPEIGRHFGAAEYAVLTKQAMRAVGLGRQAAFTVPYVLAWAEPAERARIYAEAPLPFKVLHLLTKGRYRRLASTALGSFAAAG